MGYFRRSREERERVRQVNRDPTVRRANRHMFTMLLAIFVFLFLMLGPLSPQFTGWLWQSTAGEVSPAHDLLTGYLPWYWLLLILNGGGFGVSALLLVVYLIRAIRNLVRGRRVWRDEVIPRLAEIDSWDRASLKEVEYSRVQVMAYGSRYHSAALSYFLCAFLCFLIALGSVAMLHDEHVSSLPFQARADLAQIEAGALETVEVWVSPQSRSGGLPGPYGSGQPRLITRRGIVGEDTGYEWVIVRIPNALNFSLDPDRLFDETRPAAWNLEHAQQYRVSYTSNFHLVTEITPIGGEEP